MVSSKYGRKGVAVTVTMVFPARTRDDGMKKARAWLRMRGTVSRLGQVERMTDLRSGGLIPTELIR